MEPVKILWLKALTGMYTLLFPGEDEAVLLLGAGEDGLDGLLYVIIWIRNYTIVVYQSMAISGSHLMPI